MSTTSRKELFRGMDEIAWGELHHGYGAATDVPDLLRALASPDKPVRAEAWRELYGSLWHQGTIYEATACAVPFLIELLKRPEIFDKAEILAYLAALFDGKGYWQVHARQSRPDRPPAQELELILMQEKSWVETTRSAIRGGNKAYFRLLRQGDTRTKLVSAYLLGLIGETELDVVEEILRGTD
jgi:hypothetical protein